MRRQIFCQTRRFCAGGLSPGKEKQRSMAENMQASCVRIICGLALNTPVTGAAAYSWRCLYAQK